MSDPRTPSRAERERLRALAERARDTHADAQRIWSRGGQTPMWEAASLVATNARHEFEGGCSPSVVLSLLAALDEGEQRATAFGVDQEGSTARTEAPA